MFEIFYFFITIIETICVKLEDLKELCISVLFHYKLIKGFRKSDFFVYISNVILETKLRNNSCEKSILRFMLNYKNHEDIQWDSSPVPSSKHCCLICFTIKYH